MFASYLIGLREGLEAALVVSILVAFLVKSGHRDRLRLVWTGAVAAALVSIAAAYLLAFTSARLGYEQRELFEAVTSVTAVVLVTWMIFWMRRSARRLAHELRSRLAEAIRLGPTAVLLLAFLAVVREGLETALLFIASAQGSATFPLIGISLGVLTSIAIGWALYAAAIRINLTRFFRWTGVLLIVVAAGILKYGVHDLQEAGVLPGQGAIAFDASGVLPGDGWWTALLSGMFNLTPQPSVLETVAWVAYVVPVLVLFLLPSRPSEPAASGRLTSTPVTSATTTRAGSVSSEAVASGGGPA